MHKLIPSCAPTRPLEVAVIGAGGTGSQVITALAQINYALGKLGHPGLNVIVVDDDTVSESNVGRQMFYPADIGNSKAEVLVHRVNMTFGTRWQAASCKIQASDRLSHQLVIGCVDTRLARYNIMRAIEEGTRGSSYWLDFGNRQYSGQCILGEVTRARRKTNPGSKLPHVGELFPEVIDPTVVDPDEGPSCSMADALAKQSLMINRTLVALGMHMLSELLVKGETPYHGVFVNLATGRSTSLDVDPKAWQRFGYGTAKSQYRHRHFRRCAKPQVAA